MSLMVFAACDPKPRPDVTPPTQTLSLPTPPFVNISEAPDVEAAAKAYLDLWVAEDYPAMYAQLSRLTKDAITAEDFEARHRNTAVKLTMKSMGGIRSFPACWGRIVPRSVTNWITKPICWARSAAKASCT